MNAYRERYLASEHWFGLKTRAMQYYGCRCAICGKADIANDVHHIKYRNLRDVEIHDLRVLCRQHHDMVHAALERHPQIFEQHHHHYSSVIWRMTLRVLGLEAILPIQPEPAPLYQPSTPIPPCGNGATGEYGKMLGFYTPVKKNKLGTLSKPGRRPKFWRV